MGTKKDLEQLIERVARLNPGLRIERRKSGHIVVYPFDKSFAPITTSGTPSDHRGLKNFESRLRQAGIKTRETS